MWGLPLSTAVSASACTPPNSSGQRWMLWCQPTQAHVLAAILPLAVSGVSPWLQDLPQYTLPFWPIWLGSSFYWPLDEVYWRKRRIGTSNEKGHFSVCCHIAAAASLSSQACKIHAAVWLQCCDRFFYTYTLQFSCCFLLTLLWVKESLQLWKPWENGCALVDDWVTAGQL